MGGFGERRSWHRPAGQGLTVPLVTSLYTLMGRGLGQSEHHISDPAIGSGEVGT